MTDRVGMRSSSKIRTALGAAFPLGIGLLLLTLIVWSRGRTEAAPTSTAPEPQVAGPIVPDSYPEITPHEVAEVRDDAIVATGRSDFPNQVNNVLGFPFIFRGALDVRARKINDEMKLAATRSLADLAKQGEQGMPDEVIRAYEGERFEFGPRYIIPKPCHGQNRKHDCVFTAEQSAREQHQHCHKSAHP